VLHVHTETESGFRFETETGFDKWITPVSFLFSARMRVNGESKKKFFQWQTQQSICNKVIIKYPTRPPTCRYRALHYFVRYQITNVR